MHLSKGMRFCMVRLAVVFACILPPVVCTANDQVIYLSELLDNAFLEMKHGDKTLGTSFRVFFQEEVILGRIEGGASIVKLNLADRDSIVGGKWENALIEVMRYSKSRLTWGFYGFGTIGQPASVARELESHYCSTCHERSGSSVPVFWDLYRTEESSFVKSNLKDLLRRHSLEIDRVASE